MRAAARGAGAGAGADNGISERPRREGWPGPRSARGRGAQRRGGEEEKRRGTDAVAADEATDGRVQGAGRVDGRHARLRYSAYVMLLPTDVDLYWEKHVNKNRVADAI